jgi:2Fe-2S ferredoxin
MSPTEATPKSATAAATSPVRLLPHADLCPQGLLFEARQGRKLVDELLAHGVAIEHACEKVCACSTCHVHVREGAAGVAPADDAEEDQLDDAWGVDTDSRLACCVRVGATPLVVELPRFTRNHAREA